MARFAEIDDPTDERLRPYVALRDPALRRAVEAPGPTGEGLFIAEGKLVLPRLLESPYEVVSVLVIPARVEELYPMLEGYPVDVYVSGRAVLDEVAGFPVHRGVLAAAARQPLVDPVALTSHLYRVAVLEGLNDQENLGALARSAVVLGIDGLLLDPTCCDPLYRRVVRVSMGNVLHLPFARVDPWPDGLDRIRAEGFTVVALTPDATAEPIESAGLASLDRVAVLLGGEGHGLSAGALAHADRRVRIRQRSGVDSLNVGHAAAIAFHALGGHSESTK
jgi:tRNA G18 (ribose-2'-O)-methylase SpoU